MKDPQENIFNRQHSKSIKARVSGFREVSIKNSQINDPCLNNNYNLNQQNFIKNKELNQSPNNEMQNQQDSQTQIAIGLFQKCLKPEIPHSKLDLYPSNQIDSRVILKMNSQPMNAVTDRNKNQKCKSIKIGSKAQKYSKKNKSQPKKVFQIQRLSSRNEQKISNELKHSLFIDEGDRQCKKTQRKNSPNIFISTKNTPKITQFSKKLKKYEQDLKKTRKSKVLNVQYYSQSTNLKTTQNQLKTNPTLKNYEIQPKLQPFDLKEQKTSPGFKGENNFIHSHNQIYPSISYPFHTTQYIRRDEINTLQRTKRVLNHSIQSCQMITPFYASYELENKQANQINNFQSFSAEDAKFLLEKFNNKSLNPNYQQSLQTNQSQTNGLFFPQSSIKISQFINMALDYRNPSQISSRGPENNSFEEKQAITLRLTDFAKNVDSQRQIKQSISERQQTSFNTKQHSSYAHNKIRRLDEGAKTIVTKYDSSEKKSQVEESVILFQCSKDLQPYINRDFFNDYASKYRGSLGVTTSIYENEEQQQGINSKQQSPKHQNPNERQSVFDYIIMDAMNNNRLRKCHSIRQAESKNNSL